MRIALISCSKQKQAYPCAAKDMYQPSDLFRLSYQYAKQHADKVYILSARYGLLHEDELIKPYDLSLSDLPQNRQMDWANYVLKKMRELFDLEADSFMILAGKDYYQHLCSVLKNCELPLGNRRYMDRLTLLKEQLASPPAQEEVSRNACAALHAMFNATQRYTYEQIDQVPFKNGIYIMFETGQQYAGLDRIVRVGTHRSQGRLKNRLRDHFLKENKDGSIFRKNIGRTLLNRSGDPYLRTWNLNTSKPETRQYILAQKQVAIEKNVSDYLRRHITFSVFEEDDAQKRLRLETGIIATLSHAADFGPSSDWLGRFSPEREIHTSGLWLKEGLDGQPLSQDELKYIADRLRLRIFPPWQTLVSTHSSDKAHTAPGESISKVGIRDIKAFIGAILKEEKGKGKSDCVLISGDIHRRMGLSNKMPSVCSAMYALMRPGDEVLHKTPSGKSSTIKIKYYLCKNV